MSETTEMMMDGTLCQYCGVLMPDQSPSAAELAKAPRGPKGIPIIQSKAPGYPRTCRDCKKQMRAGGAA